MVTCPLLPALGRCLSFLAVPLLLVLPVSNEQRREDPPQFNQAEVVFKEMDTRKMEDRKSFNILFKLLEKVKTGVKSYNVTLFKQIEENMACFPNLPSLCWCKLLTACAVPEYQGSWDAMTQSQFMDVNQKSELIGSWTPTVGKKNVWIQAQGSQDSRPPPLGLAALPFFFFVCP